MLHPVAIRHLQKAERYQAAGDLLRAAQHCEKAVRIAPNFAIAHANLGSLLLAQGHYAQGIKACIQALRLQPLNDTAHRNLVTALHKLGQHSEAATVALKSVQLLPADTILHDLLSHSLYRVYHAGQPAQAVMLAEAWLKFQPALPIAQHTLASLRGSSPPAPAAGYVQALFDSMAASYDENMRQIESRTADVLSTNYLQIETRHDLNILDLGCGTGALAPRLRPKARYLAGVDLSSGMIEVACKLSLYDDLYTSEGASFLMGTQRRFDGIIAADVLCYTGDLKTIMTAAAATMSHDGILAFSVEAAAPVVGSYMLMPSGRYSHNLDYVFSNLDEAGLKPVQHTTAHGRHEFSRPVECHFIIARKS
ncbi:MAG: methyltransferase domain-containing protein [Alphaproteobacteria bacterium]|nr:methyltransferase domain-containing protein [Alphaproteobacteria bacterium]